MSNKLSPQTLLRYSRQIRLPQVGTQGQQKLLEARVLLIGMGALGSPVSMYLTAAGVGTLGLADFDNVEVHNLQRQIIHTEASVGTPKLESAVNTLKAINPQVRLELHPRGITVENAVELISQYDLVIDGSDNFPTRFMVSDAAFFARRPLVYGSIFQFEGQLSVFDPTGRGGPCYRCLFPNMPEPGSIPNCEEAGVFGALPGVVGSFQAIEAIKLITGIGKPLIGRLLVIDALNQRNRYLQLKQDPCCPLCGSHPAITTIRAENYDWACLSQSSSTAATGAGIPAATTAANASCAATGAGGTHAPHINGSATSACAATQPSPSGQAPGNASTPAATTSSLSHSEEHPMPPQSPAGNRQPDPTAHTETRPMATDTTTRPPLPLEVSVSEAHAMLGAADSSGQPPLLIDVREPFEHEIGHIDGSQLIPLGTVADSIDTLPRERTLLVYCHHGMRSLRATQFLRQHGYDRATSVRGGIDAWSQQIDPSIPRY